MYGGRGLNARPLDVPLGFNINTHLQSQNELRGFRGVGGGAGQVLAGACSDGGSVKFYSVVELVEKDGSVSSLLKVFNDQNSSDRIVQFLRLLTSAFIRNRADFFRHFIDEEMDIKDFCTHVGP